MAATKSKRIIWMAVLAASLVVAMAGAFAFTFPGLGKYQKAEVAGGAVAIPLAKVSDGKAHFYRHTAGGREIGFFLVKGKDGAVHTAFDTCDVCYKEKKGYVQQGDFMVCRNCNQRFAINRIGPHAIGGCNPTYLPGAVAGGSVVIRVSDIEAGARYF